MHERFAWRLMTVVMFVAGLALPRTVEAQSGEELRRWIRWCVEEQNGTWNEDPSNPVCYPGTRNSSSSQGSGARPAMALGFLVGGGIGLGVAAKSTEDLPKDDPDRANKRLEGFAVGAVAGALAAGLTLQLINMHTLPLPLPAFLGRRAAANLSIHATGVRADFRW